VARGLPYESIAKLCVEQIVSAHHTAARLNWESVMESREECLREASECDRLAGLAGTLFARNMMKVAAFHWRQLAEKAAERQRSHWSSFSETIRPN
jgi:hypothetical protein